MKKALTKKQTEINIKEFLRKNDKGLTLDEIDSLLDGNSSKQLLRSILYHIDLKNSDRDLVVKYTLNNKFDMFRILGKAAGFQFTTEELLKIVEMPSFTRVTTTGTFGSGETADIINRRAVIMHQDNVNSEVFNSLLGSFNDENAKERFLKTLNTNTLQKKYEDFPDILLWAALA